MASLGAIVAGAAGALLGLGGVAAAALANGNWRGPYDLRLPGALRRGDPRRRRMALTFDDGPHPAHTPALLQALRQEGVRATFFLVGARVDAHPEIVARIAEAGHEIGNHTYGHVYMPLHSSGALDREIADTDRAIHRACGLVPRLGRPPYGGRTPRTLEAFARARKRVALWSHNPRDYLRAEPAVLAARVIAAAEPGAVVLLHDGRAGSAATVEAVRRIVPALRERGYDFATLSELLPEPVTASVAVALESRLVL
jgi:peptidoglycan/xylan/chitin deacetylase (PgdA/CDA1 family)